MLFQNTGTSILHWRDKVMVCKQSQKILGKKYKPFKYNDFLVKYYCLQKIIVARNKRVNTPDVSQKLNKIFTETMTKK